MNAVTHYPVGVEVHGKAQFGVLDILFDMNTQAPLHISLTIDQCHILRARLNELLYERECHA